MMKTTLTPKIIRIADRLMAKKIVIYDERMNKITIKHLMKRLKAWEKKYGRKRVVCAQTPQRKLQDKRRIL